MVAVFGQTAKTQVVLTLPAALLHLALLHLALLPHLHLVPAPPSPIANRVAVVVTVAGVERIKFVRLCRG